LSRKLLAWRLHAKPAEMRADLDDAGREELELFTAV
jgi:hypothetical protein